MRSQKADETRVNVLNVPDSDNARPATLPLGPGRVLNDDEIAAVVGGILFPVFAQGVERKH